MVTAIARKAELKKVPLWTLTTCEGARVRANMCVCVHECACAPIRAHPSVRIHPSEGLPACACNGRAQVDCNFDGKVSFLEYLLYQYRKVPRPLRTPWAASA